jgi:hypothetical protein
MMVHLVNVPRTASQVTLRQNSWWYHLDIHKMRLGHVDQFEREIDVWLLGLWFHAWLFPVRCIALGCT